MKSIDSQDIAQMFLRGYVRVREHKEKINKINMFPVPDQDTGSNLEKTLSGIYVELSGHTYSSFADLSKAIIESALIEASGNVGIITTSFLSGFLNSLEEPITTVTLSQGFVVAAKKAHSSVQDPKDGTILDVIESVAKTSKKCITDKEDDIVMFFKKIIKEARTAVEETEGKMDMYKKAAVVDAGAYGLFIFLEGFLEALEKKHEPIAIKDVTVEKKNHFIQILKNRYEVVCLCKSPEVNAQTLSAQLAHLGDCIDIVEANDMMKIHIHTDRPDEVVGILETIGTTLQMRTSDMTKSVGGGKEEGAEGVGIVVDGASDIPKFWKKEIIVVPFSSYEVENPTKQLDIDVLFSRMKEAQNGGRPFNPKTSQPALGEYVKAFREAFKSYKYIVCVTFFSALSGSYNSACQARELFSEEEKKRIFIFDSMKGGGAVGLLANAALRLVQQGESFENIPNRLRRLQAKTDVFGIPTTSYWVAHGGRINSFQKKTLSLLIRLGFHPIVGIKNTSLGILEFKWGGSIASALFDRFSRRVVGKKHVEVFIAHANNEKDANMLEAMVKKAGHQVVANVKCSPVVSTHVGPGVVFCSYLYH